MTAKEGSPFRGEETQKPATGCAAASARGRKRPFPGRHRPLSVRPRPPAPGSSQMSMEALAGGQAPGGPWRRLQSGAEVGRLGLGWERGRHEDGAWAGDRARTRGSGPAEPPGWSASGWPRRRAPLRTMGRWTQRRHRGCWAGLRGATGARRTQRFGGPPRTRAEVGAASQGGGPGLRRCSTPGAVSEGTPRPGGRLPRPPTPGQTGCGFGHSAALEGSVPGSGLTVRLRPRPQRPPTAPVPPPQPPAPPPAFPTVL